MSDTARETLAQWMMQHGYATGHGDTIEDLLKELEWQVKEERGERDRLKTELVNEIKEHDEIHAEQLQIQADLKNQLKAALWLCEIFKKKVMPMALSEASYEEFSSAKIDLAALKALKSEESR